MKKNLWDCGKNVLPKHEEGLGKKKKKELVLQMMGRLSVKRMCAHFQFCPSPSSFLLLPLLPLLIMMRG